jgi:hypothetical protein
MRADGSQKEVRDFRRIQNRVCFAGPGEILSAGSERSLTWIVIEIRQHKDILAMEMESTVGS